MLQEVVLDKRKYTQSVDVASKSLPVNTCFARERVKKESVGSLERNICENKLGLKEFFGHYPSSLRKQPSFFAPSPSGVSREGRRPSRETPLGPGAKKDGCCRRLLSIHRGCQ